MFDEDGMSRDGFGVLLHRLDRAGWNSCCDDSTWQISSDHRTSRNEDIVANAYVGKENGAVPDEDIIADDNGAEDAGMTEVLAYDGNASIVGNKLHTRGDGHVIP